METFLEAVRAALEDWTMLSITGDDACDRIANALDLYEEEIRFESKESEDF